MITRPSFGRHAIETIVFGDKGMINLWNTIIVPKWLPLLMGIGLGLVLALLVDREAWLFLVVAILFIPAAILFSRYPFVGVLIWLLLVPFFVKVSTGNERYAYWMIHRALIPATLVFVILTYRLRSRTLEKPVQAGPAELAMVIFLVLVLINIFMFSPSPNQNIYHLYDHVFVPFCMYWLVRLTAVKDEDWKRFLWVAFFVLIVQSIIGLLAWFMPQLLPVQWLSRQGIRTTGTFGNPAVFSSTLIFISLLLFQQAIHTRSNKVRAVFFMAIILGFFGVIFTFSRGSWLGGLVVLLGLLFLYPKVTFKLMFIATALALLLAFSLLVDELNYAAQRLGKEETAENRIILFNTGLRMVKSKPLFGWGYGNYDVYDDQFRTRVGQIPLRSDSSSHNTYMTIMAEIGVIPFLIYIFPFLYWLVISFKTWHRLPSRGFMSWRLLALLWLVMLDHIIVSNFMDMVRTQAFGTTVWWMVMALIANLVYPYREKISS